MATTIEMFGTLVGQLLAPAVALTTKAIQRRALHPLALVFSAQARPVARDGAARRAGERLAGDVLVRLSSGLRSELGSGPDLLGVGLRFRRTAEPSPEPRPGDQDLLLATTRTLLVVPFAVLSTKTHDFLANDYFTGLPSDDLDLGRVTWRLTPVPGPTAGGADRHEAIRAAVERGTAKFQLESRPVPGGSNWTPIVEIKLMAPLDINHAELGLLPQRAGRDIVPRGPVNAARAVIYARSQRARGVPEAARGS